MVKLQNIGLSVAEYALGVEDHVTKLSMSDPRCCAGDQDPFLSTTEGDL